ncbi:MAG: SufD family Fe-S cluster assembly protein, partial [Thermoplasmata archaeon]
ELREESYERFRELQIEPNPLYRGYGYFTGVDLSEVDPRTPGPAVELPPELPGSVRVVHDASGTRVTVPSALADAGLRVETLHDLWSSGPGALSTFLQGLEVAPDRLSALATTLLNRGYRLEVPPGFREPVRVQEFGILSQPHEAMSVRRSLRAGEDAQLLITEEVYSAPGKPDGQRLWASSTDLDLADRAKVVYLTVHAPDLKTVAIYRRSARTGAGSRVAWIWNGLGGFRTKMRNQTTLSGNGSAMDDLQTFYGAKNQSYDSSVDVTHVGTDTHAQSITRGVFTDEARGMSRGLVRIEAGARKTIAYVSEHAMLLSRGARSDTIPILEILCRDVKATHSTSVAPVDPEKVFYLESRGMSAPDAIRMIGEGFLSYVLERAPVAGLRELLYPTLAARWEGTEIVWKAGAYPALPPLAVTGTEAAPEWRFDTKLR